MAVEGGGGGAGVGDLEGEGGGAAERTVPKSRAVGEKVRVEGVAVPRRLMKSSGVLESEVISRALMRVVRVAEGWGVKVTVRVQLAPGTRVVQLLVDGEVGGGLEGGDVDGGGAGVGEGDGLGW